MVFGTVFGDRLESLRQGLRVYVGRGGHGSSVSAPVFCLDAATIQILWSSAQEVANGSYDGIVFTDEDDPISPRISTIRRLNRLTGETM